MVSRLAVTDLPSNREALILDLLICLKKVGGGWWLRLRAAITIPIARDLFYESATTRYERTGNVSFFNGAIFCCFLSNEYLIHIRWLCVLDIGRNYSVVSKPGLHS